MSRWVPFDGLRAILVMGVMAHHVEWTLGDNTPIFEAGWLPVDGFFVLSGFLITTLLLREYGGNGSVDVARFYARRLARLYPALLVVLAGIGIVAVAVDDRPLSEVWPSLASASSLGHNFNYGSVSPLLTEVGPFWSLGIEFQFYLVFPLLGLTLLAVNASPRMWVAVMLTIIAASATWRATLGLERFPDSYMWTPARLDSIGWGVLLGLAYHWGWLRRVPEIAARVAAAIAIVLLAWIYFTMGGLSPRTYDWGITVAGIASAGLVGFLLVAPRSMLATGLSWPPLVALGRRSYSAYLWHQTVFLFMLRHTDDGPWTRPIIGFAVTFLLADLSYRFVEQPVLAWSRRWSRIKPATLAATPSADRGLAVEREERAVEVWAAVTEQSP